VHIEDSELIAAPREELWDYLMQIEKVGECIPGCENVRKIGDDAYETSMRVTVGPIKLRFEARLNVLERDHETWVATMRAEGAERGVGGTVSSVFTMKLLDRGDEGTELLVTTEAKILGKLGEFGQPVMKKKAAAITKEFAQNIGARLAEQRATAAPSIAY
jgi:carbon monoxide dehydrogenase subunit G